MKELPETPVNKTEHEFVLEQLEEAVFVQEEELVEDLDLSDIVRGQGEHAAITKNLTISGQVPAIPVQDVED